MKRVRHLEQRQQKCHHKLPLAVIAYQVPNHVALLVGIFVLPRGTLAGFVVATAVAAVIVVVAAAVVAIVAGGGGGVFGAVRGWGGGQRGRTGAAGGPRGRRIHVQCRRPVVPGW